jgi:rubredoxin
MNATSGDQQDPIGPGPTELPTNVPANLPANSPADTAAEPGDDTGGDTGGDTDDDMGDDIAVAVSAPAGLDPAADLAADPTADPAAELALHRFECRSCGFVYDPQEGVKKVGIPAGTPFLELDAASFRCPVCRSKVGAFKDIGPRNKPSGFEENLNYGLGVNQLTPGQKNVLIFGGFALAFAFFLSLYSLR